MALERKKKYIVSQAAHILKEHLWRVGTVVDVFLDGRGDIEFDDGVIRSYNEKEGDVLISHDEVLAAITGEPGTQLFESMRQILVSLNRRVMHLERMNGVH